MVEPKRTPASIISLAEKRRKTSDSTTSTAQSGFLETWLNAHEDTNALIQENARLRQLHARLQVTVQEHGLYLISLALYGVVLLVWALSLR